MRFFFFFFSFWSSTGHSRVRNAPSVSSVKIWQEYASKNIANVCRVSFVFKINFVDSRTQIRSAVRTFGETALRNFLRVQLNWKIAIHVCRGCCSLYSAVCSRPRVTVFRYSASRNELLVPLQRLRKSRANRLLRLNDTMIEKTAPIS